MIILILLIGGNVNADEKGCEKAIDLAEQGAKNNLIGYTKNVRAERNIPNYIPRYRTSSIEWKLYLEDPIAGTKIPLKREQQIIRNIGGGKDLIITIETEKKIRASGDYLKYGKITNKEEVTSIY